MLWPGLVYECHIIAEYVCVCKDAGAGLLAAAMIAVVPGYISRSVAGSYDNEGMHAAGMYVSLLITLRDCHEIPSCCVLQVLPSSACC